MNKIRQKFAKPMIVTSGLRSIEDHIRIYKNKGIEESKVPMKSKHLFGKACDILDTNGELYNWCLNNEEFLKNLGIWLEHRMGPWQHFQIEPYDSYKEGKSIWFYP